MKNLLRKLQIVRALGIRSCFENARYQFDLKSGRFKNEMPIYRAEDLAIPARTIFKELPIPARSELLPYLQKDTAKIRYMSEKIRAHRWFPFSGTVETELDFVPVNGTRHWASADKFQPEDLKLIWEPARFCWADWLMRAEMLDYDGLNSESFLELLGQFLSKNPVNAGENWESAQEVGLRLINIALCGSVMIRVLNDKKDSLSALGRQKIQNELRDALTPVIRAHALRIPPTLDYARSQRNNHLLSEAAALMTAACVLPNDPMADKWFHIGQSEFMTGLDDQLLGDGTYIQQSTNYQRLMLQLVLWVDQLLRMRNMDWPQSLSAKIRQTILNLNHFCDPLSGKVCNLGHNDGSLLFSFGGGFADYRPTLYAASAIFLPCPLYDSADSRELSLWMNVRKRKTSKDIVINRSVLRIDKQTSWAMLRTAAFHGRPAHDDQLDVSVWMNGRNEVIDAGTYRYSGESNWENRLKVADVHNGLLIDGKEPMTDAGKFLWLDWDSVSIIKNEENCVSAEHSAPRRYGLRHIRTLETAGDFRVIDEVSSLRNDDGIHSFRLHWLLPDQKFFCIKGIIRLERIRLTFNCDTEFGTRIIRAGTCVYSEGESAEGPYDRYCGWVSPTYGVKQSALSVILTCRSALPFRIETLITSLN